MSKRIKDVVHVRVATTGDKETKIYTKHGVVIETNNGGLCLILNSMPFPDSEGKVMLQLYDPKPKQDGLVEPKKKALLIDEE
jgi:hypothetical protein